MSELSITDRARQIVIDQARENCGFTAQYVEDALDCAGHAVIKDSYWAGIAASLAARLLTPTIRDLNAMDANSYILELRSECKSLRNALNVIIDALNPDREDSYRADDPEGAMETVYWIAKNAIEASK